MDDARELSASLAKLVRAAVPEVDRMPGCVLARVKKVHESGGRMTGLEPRYSVDVQVLDPRGGDDTAWPVVPDVEIPVQWAGPDRGVYCVPAVGAIVRVGFEYGDPNRPYVESVTGRGYSAPDHPVGTWVVRAGDTRVEISEGQVRIKGSSKVLIESDDVELGADGGEQLVKASLTCPYTGLAHGLVPPAVPGGEATPAPGLTTKTRAT